MLTIEGLIDDRPADGVFRVHRDVFTDEQIFALEQQHIFEKTWVFFGLGAARQARDDTGFVDAFLYGLQGLHFYSV
jgi:hypothetical protein